MNDYSDDVKRIQNKTINDIEDTYKEMISQYRRKINANIIDCIEDTFRGISEGKIEDWIDELFLEDFKAMENHNFTKIEQVLNNYKNEIPRGLEDEIDLSRLINNYREELVDVLKKHNIYEIDDIISNFTRQISNKISYYLEVFKGISEYNIESKIDELKYSLRRRLESVMTQYYEEYNFQIVNILNNNIKSIRENVKEIKENKKIPQELINKIHFRVTKCCILEKEMIYSNSKFLMRGVLYQLVIINYGNY